MSETHPFRDRLDQLEQMRDELRVRAHLAGMDAKKAWDAAHVERIGDALERVGSEAKLSMHLASREAREAWNRADRTLRDWRTRSGASMEDASRALADALDDAVRAFRGEGGGPRDAGAKPSSPDERTPQGRRGPPS